MAASPETWMKRAIALSRRGLPAPNPHVGCVIVRNGECVGEGFHAAVGQDHAEVVALKAAGARARGSDLYVTLEPCAHTGRTPPCATAVARAGVKRVFVAVPDPNPKAAGGAAVLRESGVHVEVGLLAEHAEQANEQFLTAMRHQRPFVVLKAAMSLDGRIALPNGESQWITSETARRAARRLRAELGAVAVGAGTVLADNPRLTARLRGVANPPLRVILDPEGKTPKGAAVFSGEAPTVRYVSRGNARIVADIEMEHGPSGFDLSRILEDLWQRQVTGLLVEGGGKTLASFLKADYCDRLELFVAGKVFGAGPSWVEGLVAEKLALAPLLSLDRVRRIGGDLWLTYRPTRIQ